MTNHLSYEQVLMGEMPLRQQYKLNLCGSLTTSTIHVCLSEHALDATEVLIVDLILHFAL